MAPDADATAGPPQGWHDLEAVLAEEPVARLLAAYLGELRRRIVSVGHIDVVPTQPGPHRGAEIFSVFRGRFESSSPAPPGSLAALVRLLGAINRWTRRPRHRQRRRAVFRAARIITTMTSKSEGGL